MDVLEIARTVDRVGKVAVTVRTLPLAARAIMPAGVGSFANRRACKIAALTGIVAESKAAKWSDFPARWGLLSVGFSGVLRWQMVFGGYLIH